MVTAALRRQSKSRRHLRNLEVVDVSLLGSRLDQRATEKASLFPSTPEAPLQPNASQRQPNASLFSIKHLDHWRSEQVAAVKAGKLVIVYLAKPRECYRTQDRSNTLELRGAE